MERTEKGTFAKGHKGFKPKGTKHTSSEMRMRLDEIISIELEKLPEYIEAIEKPETKARILIDLLPYRMPKLQSVQYSELLEKQIEKLSDEDLNKLLDAVTEKMKEHE